MSNVPVPTILENPCLSMFGDKTKSTCKQFAADMASVPKAVERVPQRAPQRMPNVSNPPTRSTPNTRKPDDVPGGQNRTTNVPSPNRTSVPPPAILSTRTTIDVVNPPQSTNDILTYRIKPPKSKPFTNAPKGSQAVGDNFIPPYSQSRQLSDSPSSAVNGTRSYGKS